MRLTFFISLLAASCFSITAQDSQLTLDRIFKTNDFRNERFGPARWTEGGKAYTTLEPSALYPGKIDIIEYVAKSGIRSVLVSADLLIPEGKTQPLTLEDYQWSHAKRFLLIYTNSQKVWRDNTRGDYWVLNLSSGQLRQLGVDFQQSSLMFAKFSPDDTRVAYVSSHNIYVENIETGSVITITNDGSERLINGTFDWAYEEEFGIQDGFRWSPDGNQIAYWQLDATEIRDFLMINNTDSIYSYTVPVQYPKVGEDPSSCRIGVVNATGGAVQWIPVPGDSKQNYLPRMMWAPDSRTILIQQIPRKQNTNRIWAYSVADQSIEHIYTDTDEAWVSAIDDWIWLNHGKEFSWISEKSGWKHFYRVKLDGTGDIAVTNGDYDLISIELLDDNNSLLLLITLLNAIFTEQNYPAVGNHKD